MRELRRGNRILTISGCNFANIDVFGDIDFFSAWSCGAADERFCGKFSSEEFGGDVCFWDDVHVDGDAYHELFEAVAGGFFACGAVIGEWRING